MLRNMKRVEWPPPTNLRKIQQVIGIIKWWITWRNDNWLFFFRRTKKKESMKSMNFEMKYHQVMSAALKFKFLESISYTKPYLYLLQSIHWVGVVNRLTVPTILASQPISSKPVEHPKTEEYMAHVVDKDWLPTIKSFFLLHKANSSKSRDSHIQILLFQPRYSYLTI